MDLPEHFQAPPARLNPRSPIPRSPASVKIPPCRMVFRVTAQSFQKSIFFVGSSLFRRRGRGPSKAPPKRSVPCAEKDMVMKICILGNQARSVYLFWRVLMQHMLAEGHTVFCLLPGGDATTEESIKQLGVRVVNYRLDRKGINPLRDVVTFLDLKRVLGKERPDLLFATTIKPVIYGCMAAKLVRIPHIYATITGLGYAFEADTFFKKCINRLSILLYHTALRGIEGVFFQNRDDAALFRKTGILSPFSRVLFARGTGVDIGRFAAAPQPDGEKYTFLVVGRLLEAKGYREYARAASILRKKWPNAVFQILGPRETGLGSIPPEELEAWQKDGSVVYLGEARDVRPYVAQANVVVLPSWREGTPTSIMEAMSMGRACVVTDVPGCREVVRDGVNGFLCPVKNPEALAETMEKFLKNPALAPAFGEAGRRMAVEEFDAQKVADRILSDMYVR